MSELTYREMQIAEMTAAGLTAKQIAERLGIAPQTVKNLKSVIYQKLGVKNGPAMVSLLKESA